MDIFQPPFLQTATLESTTKAQDLMEDVGRELCLTSLDQFGLYIETESGERRCIMSEEYILDVLRLTLPDAMQQQQQHQQQASQKRVVLCKQRAHFFIAHDVKV